jgi:hypothetical protein
MTTPPVGVLPHNVVKIHFTLFGGSATASTGLAMSGGSPASTVGALQQWATAAFAGIKGAVAGNLDILLTPTCSLSGITVAYMVGRKQQAAAVSSGASEPGSGATAVLPPQAALVFSSLTDRTGKSYRGRNYWPATGALLTAAGVYTVTQALVDEFAAVVGAAAAAAPTGGMQHVIYSPTLDVATPVTGYRVDAVIDTQRRRGFRGQTGAVTLSV